MTAPPYGSPDYDVWEQGTKAEAEARDEGLSDEHRQTRDLVADLARLHPDQTSAELLASALSIFAAGQARRQKLRLARRIW